MNARHFRVIRWTHVGMQVRRHDNGMSLSSWYSLLCQGGHITHSSSSSKMKRARARTHARTHTHTHTHTHRRDITTQGAKKNEAYRCQLKLYFVLHHVNEMQSTTGKQ